MTTIQSLAAKNRFLHEFAPTDFQLIISDEAHRTISGNNRAIFEYYVGAKLGLTATPKDYLKGVNEGELRQEDPRALEKRLLLDTYNTFGCPDGSPTFRYSLLDAVQHEPPYLVNPLSLDARTTITTQMLSDDGYAVTVTSDEDGRESEIVFGKRDYEKRFFSDETNLSFVRCFMENAMRDPITGETGKTICFAVSRRHATKLVKLLNEEATRLWPEAYGEGSSFAVQVTSDISGAQRMTLDFSNNNLNGKSKWRAGGFHDYNTCRTRVCVTVGMMTTGYDCEDLLNVVLARPIFSPTDFIQIKGRGTRLFAFSYDHKHGRRVEDKQRFALFDFFANCEYFEHDFDYDRELSLPEGGDDGEEGGGSGGGGTQDEFNNTSPDPLAGVVRDEIGKDGMRIDREMYRERFATIAREVFTEDATFREAVEAEDWTAVERFISLVSMDATKIREIEQIFHAILLDSALRDCIESGNFAALRACDASVYEGICALGKEGLDKVVAYINSEVSLEQFARAA